MNQARFEWDEKKNQENQVKHGVPFDLAQYAFAASYRVIAEDTGHSRTEWRYYCFGTVGDRVMTVHFTYRKGNIRIIGACYWRKGKDVYEQEQ